MPGLRQVRYRITQSPLRRPLVWLRHTSLAQNDVFVAAYPRSGSTWREGGISFPKIKGGSGSRFARWYSASGAACCTSG